MLTVLMSALSGAIAALMSVLINIFMSALEIDLGKFLEYFPLLGNTYSVLQGLALGMIALIAGRRLAMFWLGSVDSTQMNDRPVNILVRSFIAAGAVYFGGHILALMANLAKVPFDAFYAMEPNPTNIGEVLLTGAQNLVIGAAADLAPVVGNFLDAAGALLGVIVNILIAWNMIKLMLEVCERYMMVGVLVYTSPIFYPTMATKESSQIFKKWCSMFVSALIMMSVSVLFLKLIVNGLFSGMLQINFLFRSFLVLAMCKIAQRADSYLQQLGLNVATTGGSMVDDIMAIAASARKWGDGARGGSGSGGGGVGLIAGRSVLGRGFLAAKDKLVTAGSAKEAFAAGRSAVKKAASKYDPTTAGYKAFQQARAEGKTPGQAAAAAVGAGSKAKVAAAGMVFNPNAAAAGDHSYNEATKQKLAEESKMAAKDAAGAAAALKPQHEPLTETQKTDAQAFRDGKEKAIGNADKNYEKHGATDEKGRIFEGTREGDLRQTDQAALAGMNIQDGELVSKSDGAASEMVAQAMQDGKVNVGEEKEWVDQAIQNGKDGIEEARASQPAEDQKKIADEQKQLAFAQMQKAGDLDRQALQMEERADALEAKHGRDHQQTIAARQEASELRAQADQAKDQAHQKTMQALDQRVSDTNRHLDKLDARGVDPDSEEYRSAANKVHDAQKAQQAYAAAYQRLNASSQGAQEVMQAFEANMAPDALREDAAYTRQYADNLRASGTANAEYVAEAEKVADTAQLRLQDAAVQAGEERLAAAQARLEAIPDSEKNSAAFVLAQADRDQARSELERYQEAVHYSRNGGDAYAAFEARCHDDTMRSGREAYEKGQQAADNAVNRYVERAEVCQLTDALLRPDYNASDNHTTRAVATRVFQEATPDMQPQSTFEQVVCHQHSGGGRSFECTYRKADGSVGNAVFHNDAAAMQLTDAQASELKVFTAADGTLWLTNSAVHINAESSGRQNRRTSNRVKTWFSEFRKRHG